MRRRLVMICMLSMMMLVACGGNEEQVDKDVPKSETTKVNEVDAQQDANNEEENETEIVPNESPADALAILEATAKAMGQVSGMALEGKLDAYMEMMGIKTTETTEISGTVSLNPFAQHLVGQTTSDLDGTEKMEMYVVDQDTYMYTSENGWLFMPLGVDLMAAAVTDAHFETFTKHHELFDLSEDGNHYLLSFKAEGDIFKEIAYAGIRDAWGDEFYQSIINMMEDISGSYQFTVDKQSLHVDSLSYQTEMTMDGGIYSEESGTYTYSKFNEVNDIVVPTEVIESAQSLPDLGSMIGE